MNQDPKAARRDDRLKSKIDASYTDGQRCFTEKIVDLSLGGCQIEALSPLEKGTPISITISSSPPIKLKGTVRWNKKDRFKYNMGVQFAKVAPEDEKLLKDIIQAVFWSDDKWGRY